jgi:hypothetical protein
MISSATSVRGESRPEPEERKKRSTGDVGDGEGLKTGGNRSVMKASKIMRLMGRIRVQQKWRALHRASILLRKRVAVGGSDSHPKFPCRLLKMRTKECKTLTSNNRIPKDRKDPMDNMDCTRCENIHSKYLYELKIFPTLNPQLDDQLVKSHSTRIESHSQPKETFQHIPYTPNRTRPARPCRFLYLLSLPCPPNSADFF